MAEPITLTTDGMILNWLKAVGDEVKAGEVIVEIEADKATVEVEAPVDGVLTEISAEVGEEIVEGTVIGQIGSAGESAPKAASGSSESAPAPTPAPEQAEPQPEPQPVAANGAANGVNGASRTEDGRIKVSPVARNIAEERGIDLAQIPGSGPGGRIVKADVLNFDPAQAPAAPAAPATESAPQKTAVQPATGPAQQATWGAIPEEDVIVEDIPRMRRLIAEGTILSKQQIPHFYVTMGMDVAALLTLRKEINASLAEEGVKISVNDMIVKAAALTLRAYPTLNTHFYGDKLVHHQRVNIGVSVALPNNGLVNVVCHDADKRSLSDIARSNAEMYARAREGKIKPEDVRGATFTVSNLGPYDVDHFGAIISPPEAGIIAVGAAKRVPVVQEDGSIGVAHRMNVTISIDHRVGDGAGGAEWLRHFKGLIENPMRLLV